MLEVDSGVWILGVVCCDWAPGKQERGRSKFVGVVDWEWLRSDDDDAIAARKKKATTTEELLGNRRIPPFGLRAMEVSLDEEMDQTR